MLILTFAAVYLGMFLGELPQLKIDRTGIALLGAIALIVTGEVGLERAVSDVDAPTLVLLFSMMVLSAQLRLGGFYTAVTRRFVSASLSPRVLLAWVVLGSGLLSAIFTNDIIALAIAPVLIQACAGRRLHPVPFLLALACATNVGSAATLIGNPQNILVGQVLRLSFPGYLAVAIVPSVLGLGVVWLVVERVWGSRLAVPAAVVPTERRDTGRPFHSWQTLKGLILAGVLLVTFLFTSLPRELVALTAAAIVLTSRSFHTSDMLGLIDWEVLVLFVGLFIVNGAFEATGVTEQAVRLLAARGVAIEQPGWLLVVTLVLSNAVSNVPAVMLLLPLATNPLAGPTLALASTLAGNLLVVGSIANIIVIEQAARQGIAISWADHARVGVPVTIVTLTLAGLTIALAAGS